MKIAPADGVNSEIQDVYKDIVNVKTVAEEHLKLKDFIPASRNVVVEPIPPDKQTKGGLLIPDQAQTDKSVGWVVATNPADHHEAPWREGDLVYYRFGSGQQIRIEGRDVVVLQFFGDTFGDILGYWPADKVAGMSENA